jgi:urease accessory protein UreE
MHITFVRKRNADGSTCGKCAEIEARLARDGHLPRIDATLDAEVEAPDSPGMRLARELGVRHAPFFVVRDGDAVEVHTIYLKFVREVLERLPRGGA